jgi:hypothetical protein
VADYERGRIRKQPQGDIGDFFRLAHPSDRLLFLCNYLALSSRFFSTVFMAA